MLFQSHTRELGLYFNLIRFLRNVQQRFTVFPPTRVFEIWFQLKSNFLKQFIQSAHMFPSKSPCVDPIKNKTLTETQAGFQPAQRSQVRSQASLAIPTSWLTVCHFLKPSFWMSVTLSDQSALTFEQRVNRLMSKELTAWYSFPLCK